MLPLFFLCFVSVPSLSSQMYSGMFTHYIKPVLSMPLILKVFGLLGYQPCSGRHEQLHRQSPGVSSAAPGNLLNLSCAFFLARCECRLLLSALGTHGGEAEWELSLVRERQRGCSLQVSPISLLNESTSRSMISIFISSEEGLFQGFVSQTLILNFVCLRLQLSVRRNH